MDRGAWRAAVHGGHNELDTTERLSTQHTRDGIIKETVTSTGEGLETSRPHGNCTQCSQQYTHGSQRVETTQRPINEETDQQKVVYSFSGLYIILEMEMAPHCSSLAWRIPWTEEPGGLQTMGPQESSTTEGRKQHVPNLSHKRE